MVDGFGWSLFFLSTIVIGIPGLVMLARFVPLGVREPNFDDQVATPASAPTSGLLVPGLVAAAILTIAATLLLALLDALQAMRANPPAAFDMGVALWRLAHPADIGGWLTIVGILAFAIVGGMFIAAMRVRRQASTSSRELLRQRPEISD
jgi:PAT family beta-lactamase induction signal transducer AmpG